MSADGACRLEVTRLDGKNIKRCGISPQKNLAGAVSGAKLSFAVAKPVYLIVAIDDLRTLVIAIDPPETNKPPAKGRGIYNVTTSAYNADPTGKTPSTTAIQKAIDDAGKDADKKGIVYVPDGVYRVSELRLPSDVSLYLESGAVLRLAGTRDELKKRFHKKSRNADGTWMIYTADGASNVRIFGRGTLDGDSILVKARRVYRLRSVLVRHVNDKDLLDSNGWLQYLSDFKHFLFKRGERPSISV